MTRRKKHIYLAVVALGGIGLIVDRVFLSDGALGPAEVSASDSGSTGGERGLTAGPEVKVAPIPELFFPRKLPAVDLKSAVRDWFLPPKEVLSLAEQDGLPGGGRAGSGTGEDGESASWSRFAEEHRLEAVCVFEELEVAVVDGVWLRVGDPFGGCTLRSISGREVRFECAGEETVLALFDDLLAPG